MYAQEGQVQITLVSFDFIFLLPPFSCGAFLTALPEKGLYSTPENTERGS